MEGKTVIAAGPGQPVWALGFMTGTSMDGVDAAVLLTDGETVEAFGPSVSVPFSADQSAALKAAIGWAAAHWPGDARLRAKAGLGEVEAIRAAEAVLHEGHVEAIRQVAALFRAEAAEDAPDWQQRLVGTDAAIAVMGFHGQTVLHRPEEGYTLQIGNAALLAEDSPIPAPVVHDFRSADMVAGGQGAPLAPFYHFALARHIGAEEPVAFLNIGGVANVTWVDPTKPGPEAEGALIAFDTGPGNALVNDWMTARTGAAMDAGGQAAAAGRVHRDRLRSNWGQEYLRRRPPKSLDRNDFEGVLGAMEGLSIPDGAATLTAYTADCVSAARAHMPTAPARWLVCGGGRLNATMMEMLSARLGAPVEPVEAVGLDGDMLEAQAFAYLAVRVLRGLPTSAPSTTGAREPVSGGRIVRPRAG